MENKALEVEARRKTVDAYSDAIRKIIPGVDVKLIGSNAWGWALPHSDIDLCLIVPEGLSIKPKEEIALLSRILNELQGDGTGLAEKEKGLLIAGRKPVIRMVDRVTQFNVDVTLARGTIEDQTIVLVESWKKEYPGLKHMYYLMKTMLDMRGACSFVSLGAIGSFPLLCWIIAWYQSVWIPEHGAMTREEVWKIYTPDVPNVRIYDGTPETTLSRDAPLEKNLGGMLLSLMKFIEEFPTRDLAVDLLHDPVLVNKATIKDVYNPPHFPYQLTILPPLRELRENIENSDTINYAGSLACATSGILSIQFTVRSLYDRLRHRIPQYERGARSEILGSILNREWRPYYTHRQKVQEEFKKAKLKENYGVDVDRLMHTGAWRKPNEITAWKTALREVKSSLKALDAVEEPTSEKKQQQKYVELKGVNSTYPNELPL